jgi:pantothenate kinase
MSKEMRQGKADRRMVEARKGTEMTLDMKALLTFVERQREEIRKESKDEQD